MTKLREGLNPDFKPGQQLNTVIIWNTHINIKVSTTIAMTDLLVITATSGSNYGHLQATKLHQ